MARTSKTWCASSTLGLATKAPRAGSSVTSRSRLSWLSAWRTSVRDTPKMSAICCSASLVPGISRRSTMAVVMESTMRCVGPAALGSARPGDTRGARFLARNRGGGSGAGHGGRTWQLNRACVVS